MLNRFVDGQITEQKIDIRDSAKIKLKPRDSITLPFYSSYQEPVKTVQIIGMVANPGTFNISDGEKLSSIIKRAGDISDQPIPMAVLFFESLQKILSQILMKESIEIL